MPRERASIQENDARRELYGQAAMRVKDAIKNGYYLEAITLIESLVSDRLESYIEKETQEAEGFRSLGQNIQLARRHARKSSISEATELLAELEKIDDWRKSRNVMLHEAVKIEADKVKDWSVTMNEAQRAADNGWALFESVRKIVAKLKRRQQTT